MRRPLGCNIMASMHHGQMHIAIESLERVILEERCRAADLYGAPHDLLQSFFGHPFSFMSRYHGVLGIFFKHASCRVKNQPRCVDHAFQFAEAKLAVGIFAAVPSAYVVEGPVIHRPGRAQIVGGKGKVYFAHPLLAEKLSRPVKQIFFGTKQFSK